MDTISRLSPYVRLAHYYPVPAGWRIPPRVINDHLLLYTRDASGWLRVEDCTYRITPRSLLLVPPGALHETWYDAMTPILMYNLHFDYMERDDSEHVPICSASPAETRAHPERIRQPFEGDPSLTLPVAIEAFAPAVYEQLFFTIHSAAQTNRPFERMREKAAMLELLAHLYTAGTLSDRQVGARLRARELLAGLPGYIEERLADGIGVRDLCEFCHLSRTHLRRLMVAAYGVTPADYLSRCRMTRARYLLQHEQIAVAQVAGLCGYQSVQYFTRVFSAAYGMPPGQYRVRMTRTT